MCVQVRNKLKDALEKREVTTRNAYLIIEHEWMHLETLAYMLAQEQRLKWEDAHGTPLTAPGTPSKAGGFRAQTESISGSSDDEGMVHANGGTHGTHMNGHANGRTNCREDADTVNGHTHHTASANGHENGHSSSASHSYKDQKSSRSQHAFVQISAGSVALGIDLDPSKNFAWDNEGPQQESQHVSSFQAAVRPVSHAQFYEFAVTARGYVKAECWNPKDLAIFKNRGQTSPATWTIQVVSCLTLHSGHNICCLGPGV